MFKNILVLLVSVVATLALFEIGLRAVGISYPVFDDYDPVRGMRLRPGKTGWYRKEGQAHLSINSLGYRDVERPWAKAPGTFRIAVLGDSFTEARQVPRGEAFWSLLESDLSRCRALSGMKVEVMNFGIGGYNTSQELLTLRQDALDFSPDLVLVAFFAGNDVEGNSKTLSARSGWRVRSPHHVYREGKLVLDSDFHVPLWTRALYEGIHRLRVLELVNEARRAWNMRRMTAVRSQPLADIEPGTSAGIYAPPRDEAWREAWRITETLLLRMRDLSAARGAAFALVTIPAPIQVHPDDGRRQALEQRLDVTSWFYPDRRLAAFGEQHGFPVIVLAERMQRMAVEQASHFHGFENTALGTGHLNGRGHRVAAKLIRERLCSPDLLGRAPVYGDGESRGISPSRAVVVPP